MTGTPHISTVVHMTTSWGTCNVIISSQAIASVITWFDYFITVFIADWAALSDKVLYAWMPRDIIEVKHLGQGAQWATLLHWGFVEGPLDTLTSQVTGKHGWEKYAELKVFTQETLGILRCCVGMLEHVDALLAKYPHSFGSISYLPEIH